MNDTRWQAPTHEPDLGEIALAFCKECLGWTNAYHVNDFGYRYVKEKVSKELADTSVPVYERHFHYQHLDKITEKVEAWCAASRRSFLLDVVPSELPVALVTAAGTRVIRCKAGEGDPRRLILLACLEANRQSDEVLRYE